MSGRMGGAIGPFFAPGQDAIANVTRAHRNFVPFSLNSAGTFTLKSLPGELGWLQVLGGTLGQITVWDNTTNSGATLVPNFTVGAAGLLVPSALVFNVGLTITLNSAMLVIGGYS